MKQRTKEKLFLLALSALVAAGVVCIVLFVPKSEPWDDRILIVAAVFSGVWMFCMLPAYLFGMRWEAERLSRMNKEEAFRWGFFWGYCLDFLLLFVPLLLAPGLAFLYYFSKPL